MAKKLNADELKFHSDSRKTVRDAYEEIIKKGVYVNTRYSIPFEYRNSKNEIVKEEIDPMVSAAVVNCLVPKSCLLFRGGHGGG